MIGGTHLISYDTYGMPESAVCLNVKGSLQEIKTLKETFDTAYSRAVRSNDGAEVRRLRKTSIILSEQIDRLKETVWIAEAEQRLDLRKQYFFQKNLLTEMGILMHEEEWDASGNKEDVYFINGIDGKEYPIPSYQDLLTRIIEKKELLKTKMDQGFMKLLLVPFAVSASTLVDKLGLYLKSYKIREGEAFFLDERSPVYNNITQLGDRDGKLMYRSGISRDGHRGGATKREILNEGKGDRCQGWQPILLQAAEGGVGVRPIPRDGKGRIVGTKTPRMDLEAGKMVIEYENERAAGNADPTSPYYGEVGITLEDWIMAFMTHLEETGAPLDEWDDREGRWGSGSYLTGAHFPENDIFFQAYWAIPTRRVIFNMRSGEAKNPVSGVRTAVRI